MLGLVGDLGAGKTQFIQGLAAGLGHPGAVTSPTFTLVHEYLGGRLPLCHFDLYRLDSEDELLRIGLDDYLGSRAVLALEWADKFRPLLPRKTVWIHIQHESGDSRVFGGIPADWLC